jgi:hypothetical protein
LLSVFPFELWGDVFVFRMILISVKQNFVCFWQRPLVVPLIEYEITTQVVRYIFLNRNSDIKFC